MKQNHYYSLMAVLWLAAGSLSAATQISTLSLNPGVACPGQPVSVIVSYCQNQPSTNSYFLAALNTSQSATFLSCGDPTQTFVVDSNGTGVTDTVPPGAWNAQDASPSTFCGAVTWVITMPMSAALGNYILEGHGAAVGVTEHDNVGTRVLGGLQDLNRILSVTLVPVEKVLSIEENFLLPFFQAAYGSIYHPKVRLKTDLQGVSHVKVPFFPTTVTYSVSAVRRACMIPSSSGWATLLPLIVLEEGDDLRVPEPEPAHRLKILQVLRIRSRPAALDEVHSKVVELLGNLQFIVD